MVPFTAHLKHIVAAFVTTVMFSMPLAASPTDLDDLFAELQDAQAENWQMIEGQILTEWSKSGSDAMDLLLKRGESALDSGDTDTAIEHFTALIDHAPEFAEGYNGRAKAYFDAGKYGPALQDIGTALTLNPRHFGALTGLAAILEETGSPEDALLAYREVLAIHPHLEDVKTAIERLTVATQGTDL